VDSIITLESEDYSGNQFAAEVQNKITAISSGAATVCVYDNNQSRNMSVNNLDMTFFTDAELKGAQLSWGGTAYDVNRLNSGSELTTNVLPNLLGSAAYPAKYYLNLTPVRNIYMVTKFIRV
jgi:hypothetical protein